MKVCHVTNVHPRFDRRIFFKECFALRDAGHEVYLIAPGGESEREVIEGITIIRGPGLRRKRHFLRDCRRIMEIAGQLRADVYHLHDPWLLPFGFAAKRRLEAAVIFDAHEDYVAEALVRSWMPGPLRRMFAWCIERYERRAARMLDAFVVVDRDTLKRVEAVGGRAVTVENYVPRASYPSAPSNMDDYVARGPVVLHTGALNESRGSRVMVEAAAILKARGVDFRLLLVDRHYGDAAEGHRQVVEMIRDHDVANCVELVPEVRFDRLGELLSRGAVGLSILADLPGWDVATPTKIFEYMAYTMPVVGYRHPGHAAVIEGSDAGWLFDDYSGQSLADCLARVLPLMDERYRRGVNAFNAFRGKYTWEDQAARLVGLYEELAASRNSMRRSGAKV